MTEVNSAESYYQYRAESDSKIKSMSEEISRLNTEITNSKLQIQIDKYVTRNGGNEDVSTLIFNQLKGSDIDIESLPESIEHIRENPALRSFFAGTSVPAPAPVGRVFKQSWEY